MRIVRSPQPSRGWVSGLLLITLLTLAMVAQSIAASHRTDASEVVRVEQLALNVAYLADPQRPQLDLAQARLAGARVTNSAAEARRLGEGAEGIIIDRPMLTAVDHDWLVAQHRQGKLIVGVNVPFSQLAAAADFPMPPGPGSYREEWPGRTFYSFSWRVQQGSRSQGATGSDHVADTVALLGVVGSQLRVLHEARNSISTIRPTPSGAPIRPRPATP
jgi:hypothetical protein